MISVVEEFKNLPKEALLNPELIPESGLEDGTALAEHAKLVGAKHGIVYADRCHGRNLALEVDDGTSRIIHRRHSYAVAPLGQERDGAAALVAAIAQRHGPGRWWSTGPAVSYIWKWKYEGMVRGCTIAGVTHVLLAAYYLHDPEEKRA